jgi:hypothetical protein
VVGKGKAPKKLQMRVGATDVSFYHGQVGKYLIICALSYNPHTNLHINKSTEA